MGSPLKVKVFSFTKELKWTEPDEEGLIKYMCEEKGFNEDRIRNSIKKLAKAKSSSTQGRLDSFFKVVSVTPAKRKSEDKDKGKNKKLKGGAGSKFKKPK